MRRAPLPLLIAGAAQALQALLLIGVGVATMISGATGASADLLNALLVAALAIGGGAGLLAVARGLVRGHGWAHAPALVWQLIMIGVGFTMLDDLPGVAYPLLASVVLVIVGLFAPSTGAALRD